MPQDPDQPRRIDDLDVRGWVEPAPELARDRRESWWRAVPEDTSWTVEDFPTPEAKAIVTQLNAQLIAGDLERLRRHLQTESQWSPEWLVGSGRTRSFLFLTAAKAQAMQEELNQVVQRWAAAGRRAREAGEVAGRRPYFHFMYGFPERAGSERVPPAARARSAGAGLGVRPRRLRGGRPDPVRGAGVHGRPAGRAGPAARWWTGPTRGG